MHTNSNSAWKICLKPKNIIDVLLVDNKWIDYISDCTAYPLVSTLGGEFGGEEHRQLVNAVGYLFERSLGFKIYETCYDGPETAMVRTENDNVRFDILMKQEETEGGGIHYFCECKFRSRTESRTELRSQLRTFLDKALKVLPYMVRKYGTDHFCFLFVSTVPFDIWEENISNVGFLGTLLNASSPGAEDLATLSSHLKVTIMPTWFILALRRRAEV